MMYIPQNILAQEWTFLLAYISSFPTHPHLGLFLFSFSSRVKELLGWISPSDFVRCDAKKGTLSG